MHGIAPTGEPMRQRTAQPLRRNQRGHAWHRPYGDTDEAMPWASPHRIFAKSRFAPNL
jgi:hypothetical protein